MKRIVIALATVAMVFGFVGATLAADWNFYGSVRTDTFWDSQGKQINGTNSSQDTLLWENAANARFGAFVKDNDNLSGAFQFGVPTNGGSVYTRLLYGVYNFGSFKLKVGQDYTPVNIFYSNQVYGGDTDMLDMGMPYNGRHAEIDIMTNGFEVALVDPTTDGGNAKNYLGTPFASTTVTNVTVDGAATTDTSYGVNGVAKVELPKIEAKYTFTVQNVTLQAYGGYQTYKLRIDTAGSPTQEQTISSWIGGVGAQSTFGPFYANGTVWVAQNPTDYGLWYDNSFARDGSTLSAGAVFNETTGGTIQKSDTSAWGGGVVLGYHISNVWFVEAGYSYTTADNNNSGASVANAGKLKAESQEYYIQAPITIAKGVSFSPEAGVFDYMNSKQGGVKTTNGTDSYIGAKWQIDF